MQNRRFTRLTNAFSKKFENHVHALALYFMFYNFVRIHKTLQHDARDGRWRLARPSGRWKISRSGSRRGGRRLRDKRGPYKKRATA